MRKFEDRHIFYFCAVYTLGVLALALIVGITFGILFFLTLGGIFWIFCGLNYLAHNNRYQRAAKFTRRILIALLVLGILSFLMVEVLVLSGAVSTDEVSVDNILILGAGLRGDIPSFLLAQRLEKGIEYFAKNPQATIYVSGGQGGNERITEAEAMRKYLIVRGIPAEHIIKEDKSSNTLENLKLTKQLLDRTKGNTQHEIMIISNDFHLFRAKKMAEREGFRVYGYPAKTPIFLYINYAIREYFGVLVYLILGIS